MSSIRSDSLPVFRSEEEGEAASVSFLFESGEQPWGLNVHDFIGCSSACALIL